MRGVPKNVGPLGVGRSLVTLVPNLSPDSVRPGDVLLHKHKPNFFGQRKVVDYSDRRLRFSQFTGEFEFDYTSTKPYLMGLLALVTCVMCVSYGFCRGFWIGICLAIGLEVAVALCRSKGRPVTHPVTGVGTLYLYRMHSEPFTKKGFVIDLPCARRLIPYSLPALLGVVTGVYTDIYRTPIYIELTTIGIDCYSNCEIFHNDYPIEYHTKLFA